jgi:hypothetical protein
MNLYEPPRSDLSTPEVGPRPGAGDETVATIIPYRNAPALIAYYLGLFSCFPVLGLIMAIVALILGVKGLGEARRNPQAHGKLHAWVGLVCGTIGLMINGVIVTALVIGIAAAMMKR